LGNPGLGLKLGKEVRFDDLGAGIERRLAQSLTLFDAIKTYTRAMWSVSRDRIWLAQGEEVSWFFHKASSSLTVGARHAEHALLILMTKIIRLAGGQDWQPEQVRVQTEPLRQFAESDTFCDAEVRFGDSVTAIALPTRLLSARVRGGNGSSRSREGRWLELLRSQGRETLANGVPSIETAAEMLGTSPRTLQRRLAHEGLTYFSFVDQLRFERAMTMVEGSDASVGEIARLVGYSAAPHFSRAFRRWTGTTCQAIRSRLVSK
jgi:AraC-like DNA-binding protein